MGASELSRRKICIIITTRGNYAKMKSVIENIQKNPHLELQLILGGGVILEKYGRILHSGDNINLPVDRMIHFLLEGENPVTMAKSAGIAVTEFSTAFEDLKPDVVFVIADRFECLPIAMSACYMNIPVAHMEGGEVSGSIDESIRHSITKLAHLHFPTSKDAAERIERMGEDPAAIFPVGATSMDVIAGLDLDNLEPVRVYQKDYGLGEMVDIEPGNYHIVIQHPVTTEYDDNFRNVNETIAAIDESKMPVVWIWPNMDAGSDGINKGIRFYREKKSPKNAHFFKSLPIELFAPLLKNAACIIGNSSSGIREAAFIGTPTVNVGTRQGGRERGRNVIDVGYDRNEIADAMDRQVDHGKYEPDYLYGDGKSGKRITDILKKYEFTLQKRITY